MDPAAERQPLLSGATRARYETMRTPSSPTQPPTEQKQSIMRITTPWLALAAASGACAAFNGVFAKLWGIPFPRVDQRRVVLMPLLLIFRTTTGLTSSWAGAISSALGLASTNKAVEFIIRAVRLLPPSLPSHAIKPLGS